MAFGVFRHGYMMGPFRGSFQGLESFKGLYQKTGRVASSGFTALGFGDHALMVSAAQRRRDTEA